MANGEVRLDAYLVETGRVSGRERAKELIKAGAVTVNGRPVVKAATKITADDTVECDTSSLRFVSRGGLKLEKALLMSDIPVTGLTALDVGASTGGFTDCLLKAGASRVYAVDVGTDQLHPTLRQDPRVVSLEGTDIRSEAVSLHIPDHTVDLCAIDVSFISLRLILPAVRRFLKPGATILCLIKPQFEAGRQAVGKRGVVRDRRVHQTVLTSLCEFFAEQSLSVKEMDFSPVTGGEGNIEFLAVLVYSDTNVAPTAISVRELVDRAHQQLKPESR